MSVLLKIEVTAMMNIQWKGIKVVTIGKSAYSKGVISEQKECLGDLSTLQICEFPFSSCHFFWDLNSIFSKLFFPSDDLLAKHTLMLQGFSHSQYSGGISDCNKHEDIFQIYRPISTTYVCTELSFSPNITALSQNKFLKLPLTL